MSCLFSTSIFVIKPDCALQASVPTPRSHGNLQTKPVQGQQIRTEIVQNCIKAESLLEAKRAHDDILKENSSPDLFLQNTLINMYVRCGSLNDAIDVFKGMSERNVFSCTLMLSGYEKYGRPEEAIRLFWQIEEQGISVDNVAFVTALKACTKALNLEQGKHIHSHILVLGMDINTFVYNALVDMYSKCGSMIDAVHVFDQMDGRDAVSFNAIISACVQSGNDAIALTFFNRMTSEGLRPDEVTFLCILKSCSSVMDVEGGVNTHIHIVESGYELNRYIGSMLVDFYAKHGDMDIAYRCFNKILERDVVSWNAMIAGYANHGQSDDAMILYTGLRQEGTDPDEITFVNVLNAFIGPTWLDYGREVHAHAIEAGKDLNVSVGNSLIDMYGECESLEEAVLVFAKLSTRNTISWNTLIASYNNAEHSEEAIRLFEMMSDEHAKPNEVTFVSGLHACSLTGSLEEGRLMHSQLVSSGFDSEIRVQNTLVDLYIRNECVDDAFQVFDSMPKRDAVSWNAMMSGYLQHGHAVSALEMFQAMKEDGINPTEVSFISAFSACASIPSSEHGFEIHDGAIKAGLERDIFIASTIIDMYVKCNLICDARILFDKMSTKCSAAWNTIIAGYGDIGDEEEALTLFYNMQALNDIPDEFTFVSVLNVCASMSALEEGQSLYSLYVKWGFNMNLFIASALVDMHAKCGLVEDARYVFERIKDRDLFLWTVMVSGYAQHGYYQEVLELWEMLLKEGIKPDDTIYVAVLSACSHVGMVDKGIQLFNSMVHDHGITPTNDHFACFIDLLGRAGCLNEAEHIIKELPIQPDATVWRTLLGACWNHGNLELAKVASTQLLKLEPQDPAAYVFLSNTYAKGCVTTT